MISTFLLVLSGSLLAQNDLPYDPSRDGHQQIKDAVARASQEGKHVFLMIGGNW